MKFITKRQHPKPLADSNPCAVRCKKAKRPKFNDKDLNRMLEFADMFGLNHYDTGRNAYYSTSAYIEDEDDASSISSCSTNATMDNIPGTGRTIDMCFYQPVGRAIERFRAEDRYSPKHLPSFSSSNPPLLRTDSGSVLVF